MATVAPPPPESPPPASGIHRVPSAADQLIEERIENARRSLWWAELIRAGLKLALATIFTLLAWMVIDQWVYSPGIVVRCGTFIVFLGTALWFFKCRVLPLFRSTVQPEYAARALEKSLPDLRQALTSYVTLRQTEREDDLQARVVRSMGSITAGRLKNHDEIPEEAVLIFGGGYRRTFAILLGYSVTTPKNAWQSVQRLVAPMAGSNCPTCNDH